MVLIYFHHNKYLKMCLEICHLVGKENWKVTQFLCHGEI
jgi:hypothetical protein